MGMSSIDRAPRILLVIAPTMFECFRAAKEHGLEQTQSDNFRCVTDARALRGVSAGSPYILMDRANWTATPRGFDLDAAVTAMQRTGRIRPARPDDIDACRPCVAGKAKA